MSLISRFNIITNVGRSVWLMTGARLGIEDDNIGREQGFDPLARAHPFFEGGGDKRRMTNKKKEFLRATPKHFPRMAASLVSCTPKYGEVGTHESRAALWRQADWEYFCSKTHLLCTLALEGEENEKCEGERVKVRYKNMRSYRRTHTTGAACVAL